MGEPGQEQTEAKDIAGAPASDTTITIGSALNFSHSKSVPVYESDWDQISFERKPTAGSFSETAKYDIEWDSADNKTLIEVTGGVSTDTYRWRFYNTQRATYSAYSDELAGTGLGRYSVGHIIEQIRKNKISRTVDDETLIGYMNDWQAVVYDEIPKAWWFTKEGTAVATAADTYKYSISTNWSDFLSMRFMLYNYVSGDIDETYPLTFTPVQEFYNMKSDANQATDDSVRYWTLLPPDNSSAKGYIAIHPTTKTANCFLAPTYFFEIDNLDSFGDTIVIPDPKGYEDYVLYRIYDDIKSDEKNADKYNARTGRNITILKRRARRQLGQPTLFRWRGYAGWSRQFGGEGRTTSQDSRENYW